MKDERNEYVISTRLSSGRLRRAAARLRSAATSRRLRRHREEVFGCDNRRAAPGPRTTPRVDRVLYRRRGRGIDRPLKRPTQQRSERGARAGNVGGRRANLHWWPDRRPLQHLSPWQRRGDAREALDEDQSVGSANAATRFWQGFP